MATPEPAKPVITSEQYQDRIRYENELLYARVNFLFVLNGFAMVALGMNQPTLTKILLASVMVVLNFTGAFAIRQTDRVIAALTVDCLANHPADALSVITHKVLGPYQWLRPNRIFTRFFPAVITLGWIIGLAVAITSRQ